MRQFRYKAKKGPGEMSEGVMVAKTQDEAVDKLSEMGLIPVHIEESSTEAATPSMITPSNLPKGNVASPVVSQFYRQLARFMHSGIPLLPALAIASEQAQHPAFKGALEKVKESVRQGESFSRALSMFPQFFSAFDLAMIQAGESVGHLDETLTRIATYRKQEESLKSKIRMALAYPAFIMVAGILTFAFLLSFVIPKFAGLFSDLGQDLPMPTQILIATSDGIQAYGLWILLAVGGLVCYALYSIKSPAQKIYWHRFVLKIPKIGKLILMGQLARLGRTLELLLRSGLSLPKALKITLPVISNEEMKREIGRSQEVMEKGGAFSQGLREATMVPIFVVHLVRMGEESGRLGETLAELADWYEQEIHESLEVMTHLLEPIIILFVGLLLGAVIIAILLPVFSMNTVMP